MDDTTVILIVFLIAAVLWIALLLLVLGGLERWHRREASRDRPVIAMVAIGVVWTILTLLALATVFGFAPLMYLERAIRNSPS